MSDSPGTKGFVFEWDDRISHFYADTATAVSENGSFVTTYEGNITLN